MKYCIQHLLKLVQKYQKNISGRYKQNIYPVVSVTTTVKQPSYDVEYNRLTVHLDYLDEKIFKFLSLYTQIAIAIIGGTFFLSTHHVHPSWKYKTSVLMFSISIAFAWFIIHHLWAWKKYRNELKHIYPTLQAPSSLWYMSETIQIIYIAFLCVGFIIFNPLNSNQIGGLKIGSIDSAQLPIHVIPDLRKTAAPVLRPKNVLNKAIEQNNLIRNGLFNYPFASPDSGWGTGLYSDRYSSSDFFRKKQYWLNFGGADIEALIVPTQKGNALKIVNKSGTHDNVVGVMEQRIEVNPGMYELSFLAKGIAQEFNILQFCTTDDWRIEGPDGTNRGYELRLKGEFDWQRFSGKLKIDHRGAITFSIVSKGKGTIYLTDIKLSKID